MEVLDIDIHAYHINDDACISMSNPSIYTIIYHNGHKIYQVDFISEYMTRVCMDVHLPYICHICPLSLHPLPYSYPHHYSSMFTVNTSLSNRISTATTMSSAVIRQRTPEHSPPHGRSPHIYSTATTDTRHNIFSCFVSLYR